MNIALIGYGKMGKTLERVAQSRGHHISYRIDSLNKSDLYLLSPENTDVAIEFTQPNTAFKNLKYSIEQGVAVVCGTTGWLSQRTLIENMCKEKNGAFFYASNYSIGVNILFRLNELLAQIMCTQPAYKVQIEEIHHTEKLDAPSGTAITLAEGVMDLLKEKQQWVNFLSDHPNELSIISKREHDVPGTHSIQYKSDLDEIEIKHTAHTREGFALGAILAAEWLKDKKGVFGMKDLLRF
jgi:4-hydroxy-tetrahydrodipicolinate reductase